MDDFDDTVDLHPTARRERARATTILSVDESLPDLLLPPNTGVTVSAPPSLSSRFLNALLRALAPWPV